jgi:hypothetical protein
MVSKQGLWRLTTVYSWAPDLYKTGGYIMFEWPLGQDKNMANYGMLGMMVEGRSNRYDCVDVGDPIGADMPRPSDHKACLDLIVAGAG